MNQTAATHATSQYVTLGIDREVFAIEVEKVHEILDFGAVSRVPNAPHYMLGMIDVRQRTVPVIDLRSKLGLPAAPFTTATRIIVLDVEVGNRTLPMGLVADRVFEVTGLSEHAMEPPPDIGVRWRSQYIKAVGRRADAFVIVLDLACLFSEKEADLVGPAPS
jgi:purine-binding chemotaxis protein CheW